MADSITKISNILETSVPKVTIQRILLETGAPPVEMQKDPHIVIPGQSQTPPNNEVDNSLKVNITLSLKGYRKRNLNNNNILSNVFDNLDLMSAIKTSIYQIDSQGLENLGIAAGISNMFGNPQGVGFGVSYQEIYNLIKAQASTLQIAEKREINILEQLSAFSETQLTTFEYRTADGSVLYDFPFRLEAFTTLDPNPKFLAYLTVTEVDDDFLLNHIKETIGGSADYILPAEVEEYLQTFNADIINKAISYDVVFNNSTLNDQAALLQRTDTEEIWFGSYHKMTDGTLMTGVVHNDQSLTEQNRDVVLRPVLMANTKIVDLRDDEEIEKIFLQELYELENVFEGIQKATNQSKTTTEKLKVDLPENFSTSYMSKAFDGTHSCLFGIDKLKILSNKSLLAKIGQNLLSSSPFINDIRTKILEETVIKELKVFRRRVKVDGFGENRLGTPNVNQESFKHNVLDVDIENSYEDTIPKQIAILRDGLKRIEGLSFLQTALDEKRYYFYSFKDTELSQVRHGNYEYYYELILEDGITKFLTNKITFLSSYYNDIKAYYDFIIMNINNCYDDLKDQFKFDFLSQQGYANIGDIIVNIVGQMTDIMKMFNPDIASTYGMMQKKLLIISNPISGNMQGLIKFMSICETFITKIESMSGIRTGIKKYLDLAVTNLNTKPVQVPGTIEIKEVFPDNANLESINAGYEYIIANDLVEETTKANSVNSIRTIPIPIYLSMANAQLQENFSLDATNTSAIGSVNNPNKLRYFTPTQVFVDNRQYITNSHPQANTDSVDPLKPFRLDFDYYKPIVLDILEYYQNKNIDSKLVSNAVKNNIRKLVEIAGHYGVLFDNNFINQLEFLSDPAKDENSKKYSDSSKLKNSQQQTSTNNNISGIEFAPEANDASDYEDNTFESDLNQNIENFLFGMISNIVLKNEQLVPTIYQEPIGGASQNVLIESAGNQLPLCLQSLIVQFNPQAAPIKTYLAGQPQLGFNLLKELPLSLNTIGWWWLNYANIVEVRYLESYDSLFKPVWAPLTSDAFNSNVVSKTPKRILCKLYKYENRKFGISRNSEFLELPILNEYFIIDPEEATVTAIAEEEGLLAINQEDESDVETSAKEELDDIIILGNSPDLKSAVILDALLSQIKNAVKINSATAGLASQIQKQEAAGPERVDKRQGRFSAMSQQAPGRGQESSTSSNITNSLEGSNYN